MSSRQAERRRRLRSEKRGVVLLVVVSILTLFLMIGVTYVLVASNYRDASAQNLRSQRYGDEAEREAEEILGQILYGNLQLPGNNGPRSVIAPHSLLGDLYGNERVIGTVMNVANNPTLLNGGQTVQLQVNLPAPIQPIPNYFAGRVITFTNGPAAGISTRVMSYIPPALSGGNPILMVEAPESDLPIPIFSPTTLSSFVDSSFLINGAPFNGTGAGFEGTTSQNLEASITLASGAGYYAALLPNYPFYPPGSVDPTVGGLDETYDAADFQNMFLAFVPPRKLQGLVPSRTGNESVPPLPILPSYHRPDLVRYWMNALANSPVMAGATNPQQAFLYPYGPDGIRGNGDDPLPVAQADEVVALKRMIILRPLREDHPNFTGSNQNFREDRMAYYDTDSDTNMVGDTDIDGDGIFDVDNDGDNITDSIWVDAGLPVVTAPNGRRYKRLVAIMIQDLDGRVNPSVHGNLLLAGNAQYRTASPVTDTFAGMDPSAPTPVYLPRGLGFGPAEVDFRHLFNNVQPYSSANDDAVAYNNVLLQRYFTPASTPMLPGFPNNDDGWSQLKTIGMPTFNQGDHTNAPLSAYSTPPDVWGRAALAVDYTGQPIWGFAGTGERMDDPYEMQWDTLRANVDAPYTVSELEALLRYHDLGASVIPSRLTLQGAGGAGQYLTPLTDSRGTPSMAQILRGSIGMGSYIPAPKLVIPREMRAGNSALVGSSPTLLDLYWVAASQNATEFQTIVPFEFLKGQLFNLNREIGNGQQDPTGADPAGANTLPYGTVDDPSEFGIETIPTTAGPYPLNYLNDTPAPNTPDPRHMYARHLYCLAMLLRNQGAPDIDMDGDPATPATPQETARYYAQWAINVVDFRDPDSIMSPFEYDSNPFNGWNVDGSLGSADDMGSERGLVWGCERPELLITETVNFHARRTEDQSDDVDSAGNSNNRQVADPENDGVPDFDQRLSPEGATFIELYNPWFDRSNNVYDHKPAEIYTNGGVDLARLHAGANGSPVWRMIVVTGTPANKNADPDDPRPEAFTVTPALGSPTVERSIYFADLSAMGVIRATGDGETYFPSAGIPRAPVLPGRYAVIGSAGYSDGAGTYTTVIGRRTTDPNAVPSRPDYTNTRRITLTPNADPNTAQTVRIRDNLTDGTDDVNAADFQPVVALPVDMVHRVGAAAAQTHSLNVSEQLGGYPGQPGGPALPPAQAPLCMWVPPTATEEGYYSSPIDTPLDNSRTDGGQIFAGDVTAINYRALHLQRLANPLLQWNAVTNPYLTVDTSSMDVMSFNGVTSAVDPSIANLPPPPPGVVNLQNLQAFQRGGRYYDGDAEMMAAGAGGYPNLVPPMTRTYRDLWATETPEVAKPFDPFRAPNAPSPTEATANAHFQPRPLYHTLGYINRRYHPYFGAGAPAIYRGAPYFQNINGANASPFPYLAFNNRPFNNPMELLQVPGWQSSKLLRKFDGQYLDNLDPMNPTPNPTPPWTNMYQPPLPANPHVPYGHLPNFFHTAADPSMPSTAPEFSRLMDYVETRTPYIQTEKYFRPDAPGNFATDPNTPAGYRPPFNYLSRFREPGKININTIFDSNVWNAVVRGFPGMCALPSSSYEGDDGLFLTHLVLSRQGHGYGPADVLQHDPLYPSLFSQPFRTADSSDMVPPNPNAASIPLQFQPRKAPADGGLLRRDANQYPLPPPMIDENRPLFASDDITPRQDASRNPYFRYQGLQKIGNVLSTNSNCYAVWVTIGYFEVEGNDADNNPNTPPAVDLAHPDGLRLAGEVGAETGEVKRHRMFYIIDRSVPVGYEPGRRHNTDKAVLLKRFIE